MIQRVMRAEMVPGFKLKHRLSLECKHEVMVYVIPTVDSVFFFPCPKACTKEES